MDHLSCTPARGLSLSAAFNQDCRCVIVDEPALAKGLQAALSAQDAAAAIDLHSTLFAATGVFLAREDVEHLRCIIDSIERVIATPLYVARALGNADTIAQIDHGTHGVCMGYDFHLAATGPKLIEINTNAGG